MKHHQFALLIGLCSIMVAAPAVADESLTKTIQARENEWAAAYNAHDAGRLAANYEPDAVLIAPGAKPIVGRAAIEALFNRSFPILKDSSLTTETVEPLAGNHALERGHMSYQTLREDGTWASGADDYVIIWHQDDDGTWRYVSDWAAARQ